MNQTTTIEATDAVTGKTFLISCGNARSDIIRAGESQGGLY